MWLVWTRQRRTVGSCIACCCTSRRYIVAEQFYDVDWACLRTVLGMHQFTLGPGAFWNGTIIWSSPFQNGTQHIYITHRTVPERWEQFRAASVDWVVIAWCGVGPIIYSSVTVYLEFFIACVSLWLLFLDYLVVFGLQSHANRRETLRSWRWLTCGLQSSPLCLRYSSFPSKYDYNSLSLSHQNGSRIGSYRGPSIPPKIKSTTHLLIHLTWYSFHYHHRSGFAVNFCKHCKL